MSSTQPFNRGGPFTILYFFITNLELFGLVMGNLESLVEEGSILSHYLDSKNQG